MNPLIEPPRPTSSSVIPRPHLRHNIRPGARRGIQRLLDRINMYRAHDALVRYHHPRTRPLFQLVFFVECCFGARLVAGRVAFRELDVGVTIGFTLGGSYVSERGMR